MKKLVIIALLGGALMSCKKEFTCDCTVTTTFTDFFGGGSTTTTATTSTTIKDTKKKATETCENANSSTNTLGTSINTSCTLK